MGFLSYGYKAIKSVRPKTKVSDATKKFKSKLEETKKAIKKGTDDFKKENPNRSVTDKQIKTIQRQQTEKSNKKTRKEFLRERKMGGGMMGRPMYKKGSKKAVGKKSDFGMLSVKAGIDNNPKPTQADRIAGATKNRKRFSEGSKYITKKKPQYITKKKTEGSKYITRKPKFEYSGKDGSKYITRKPKKENM